MTEIILTKEDYDFMDKFANKYHLPLGNGSRKLISYAINEYKLDLKKKELFEKYNKTRFSKKKESTINELLKMRNLEDNILLIISCLMLFIQLLVIFYLLFRWF